MKRIFLNISIFMFLCLCCQSQSQKGFFIKGNLSGLRNGSLVYLVHDLPDGRLDTIAKAISKLNRFQFHGSLSLEGEAFYIRLDKSISEIAKTIFLVNSVIKLEGSIEDWPNKIKVAGSTPNDEYYQIMKIAERPLKKADSINNLINRFSQEMEEAKQNFSTLKDTNLIKQNIAKLQLEHSVMKNKYYKEMKEFVINHPNSLYVPNLIMKIPGALGGRDSVKSIYNRLSKRSKNSFYGKELKNFIEQIQIRENASYRIEVEKIAPDFQVQLPNGKILTLNQAIGKNKLILIDFWASWCKPCRDEIPNLLHVFTTFNNRGFNILGISIDRGEAAWKKALDIDKTPWMHGIVIKNNDVSKLFDVQGIPAFILMDSTKKIIAIDFVASRIKPAGGRLRGEELYKKVEEILEKKDH